MYRWIQHYFDVKEQCVVISLFEESETESAPSKTIKLYLTRDNLMKYKYGWCKQCLFEKGELVPLSQLKDIYGQGSYIYPVLIFSTCEYGHREDYHDNLLCVAPV